MKNKILISLILLSSVMKMNAQWAGTNPVSTTSNVGIGTGYAGVGLITPIEKLTIGEMGGNFAVQDRRTSTTEKYLSGYKFYDYYGESASILLEHNGYFGNSARALKFLVNGYESVLINSNGNVGIGTANPTSKLTVAGNINSREVKVTVDAGADFVFENDYNLPSLESVHTYIKENKHLPEIASADEMKKDGIYLSEMNIKLLQKIEELTLYSIEQNKKINELQEKNQKLIDLEKRLEKIESNSK